MVFVQFTDASQTVIQCIFAGPQDPLLWPDQAQIDAADARIGVYLLGLHPEAVKAVTRLIEPAIK